MYNFIKMILLFIVLPTGLFSADLDSPKKTTFSFYSYATPLLNLTSSAQQVITWLGERSGFIRRKTEIQKLAIKAYAENRKKEAQSKPDKPESTMQPTIENQEALFSLNDLLKSWQWSWDIYYFEKHACEESETNIDQQLPACSLTKSNEKKLRAKEIRTEKIDKGASDRNKKEIESSQIKLYGNTKKKRSDSASISTSVTLIAGALIDESVNASIYTSKQKDAPSSDPTKPHRAKPAITIENDPLDAIITEELYHPTEAELIMQKIDFMNQALDALEAENKHFSIFLQIAIERKSATQKCIELIDKLQFLLNDAETSRLNNALQIAKQDFIANKIDFEKKKAEFEHYIQMLLNPDTHANKANPTHCFSTAMKNIYLYNLFLKSKIDMLKRTLNSLDHYT